MENIFNQTRPESLKAAKAALARGQEELGTGIFVVPAPERGIHKTKAVAVENIPYREANDRAKNCLAFKWVAQSVAKFNKLDVKCSGLCLGQDDCAYPHWCTCYDQECQLIT
jgi:hypothetical protein